MPDKISLWSSVIYIIVKQVRSEKNCHDHSGHARVVIRHPQTGKRMRPKMWMLPSYPDYSEYVAKGQVCLEKNTLHLAAYIPKCFLHHVEVLSVLQPWLSFWFELEVCAGYRYFPDLERIRVLHNAWQNFSSANPTVNRQTKTTLRQSMTKFS